MQSASFNGPVITGSIIFALLAIIGLWGVFHKAGKPGWWAIIPFVNTFVLCKVAGKPGWWLILLFIPLVNIVVTILVYRGLARNFGKGVGFTVGLILLGFVFLPILGFGSARYNGRYGA